jgi:hypothetical protein
VAFSFGGAEGNRLHFLPVWEKIIVWRRQVVASGAHPHRIYHSIPLVLSTMPMLKATLQGGF